MVERASAQRRWVIVAIVAAVVIFVGVIWAAVATGAGAPRAGSSVSPTPAATAPAASDPAPTSSQAPAPSAAPAATPPPAVPTAAPPASDAPIAPEAAPVEPEEVAEQEGVEVELARIERVQGEAIAPGEIAGPAIRLTVDVRNGTDEPIDAGLIVVNAYFGDARTPGNSLMQPGGSPFGGSIAPGESARGVYLFESGDVELADTLVGVDVVPGQPTITFRGDLR
ncbi:hypothetical protein [Agrococcus baldri]|uniref:DUF4352 domain-containing protein n=1 Tax=Agrococcus baldri TaxID=153730 RepID=A0AA87R916_9MICO|nr:hypothetical protein [Agrococcus baldri]GEK78815.1 hypothetical protein ABA31_01660 [Agrococcus baldri]